MPASASSILDPGTALRRLHTDEAPYPGWLHAGEPQTVWVDVGCLPDELWRCRADENLLVPVDLARSADGLAAVVPHCPKRLGEVARGAPAGGVCVTIAVSMLRAAAEARRHGLAFGAWWVDADGRPVLAPTPDGTSWRADADAVLALLALDRRGMLSDALAEVRDLLARPRFTADEAAACEGRLFGAAEPLPLSAPPSPAPSVELAPRRADTLRRDAQATAAVGEAWVARFSDAEWAARLGDAARTVLAAPRAVGQWFRSRRAPVPRPSRDQTRTTDAPARGRRRAVWLVAAAVGAMVVAVGMLWPEPAATDAHPAPASTVLGTGPTPGAGATASDPSESAAPDAPPAAAGVPASAGDDLESVAGAVLDGLTTCAASASCAEIMEDPGAGPPEGVVIADGPRTVALLDEYGGVAVFRVEAGDQPAQILVLVRADGEWLVRDVYDVADQP